MKILNSNIPIFVKSYAMHSERLSFFFFCIIQRVKARVIPCPHQPPTRSDNTVSVAQDGTATPVATKQLLSTDSVLKNFFRRC